MTIKSQCQCGSTLITIKQPPDSLTECNCTFCAKHGALWAYYKPDQVELNSVGKTTTYSSNPEDHLHHFCQVCHCLSYNHQIQSWNEDGSMTGPGFGINVRLLEDFDLNSVPIKKLDGLNQW